MSAYTPDSAAGAPAGRGSAIDHQVMDSMCGGRQGRGAPGGAQCFCCHSVTDVIRRTYLRPCQSPPPYQLTYQPLHAPLVGSTVGWGMAASYYANPDYPRGPARMAPAPATGPAVATAVAAAGPRAADAGANAYCNRGGGGVGGGGGAGAGGGGVGFAARLGCGGRHGTLFIYAFELALLAIVILCIYKFWNEKR